MKWRFFNPVATILTCPVLHYILAKERDVIQIEGDTGQLYVYEGVDYRQTNKHLTEDVSEYNNNNLYMLCISICGARFM